jgi:hypothetical protein
MFWYRMGLVERLVNVLLVLFGLCSMVLGTVAGVSGMLELYDPDGQNGEKRPHPLPQYCERW